MKEITNPFTEGEIAVCISNDFPLIPEYGGTGKEADIKPKIHEIIRVDEILGDFLRFNKYDTEESNMWWHHTRFRKLSAVEKLMNLTEAIIEFENHNPHP